MPVETLVLFVAASAAVAIVPGPDILYLVGRGVAQGRKSALVSAAALNTGALVHAAFAALGVSVLIQQSAPTFYAVKYAGAAYLVYLGVRTVLDKEAFGVPGGEGPTPARLRAVFAQGVVTDLLNPKVYLFFAAFLPQFVDPSAGGVAGQMLVLGLLFVLVNLPIDSAIAWFSGAVGEALAGRPRFRSAVRWAAGGVLVALGLRLAVPERHH